MGAPPLLTPLDQARLLMSQKDSLEAELQSQLSVLRSHNATMSTSLVDAEGFPRADIDIYAVRNARVRIIELRNDLTRVMEAIGRALEGVYDPASQLPEQQAASLTETGSREGLVPFAKVNAVAPASPAAEAGLQREDLIVKFGTLTSDKPGASSLQPIAALVSQNENKTITINVLRDGVTKSLNLVPRQGWGGRGTLGCHIIPHTPS